MGSRCPRLPHAAPGAQTRTGRTVMRGIVEAVSWAALVRTGAVDYERVVVGRLPDAEVVVEHDEVGVQSSQRLGLRQEELLRAHVVRGREAELRRGHTRAGQLVDQQRDLARRIRERACRTGGAPGVFAAVAVAAAVRPDVGLAAASLSTGPARSTFEFLQKPYRVKFDRSAQCVRPCCLSLNRFASQPDRLRSKSNRCI